MRTMKANTDLAEMREVIYRMAERAREFDRCTHPYMPGSPHAVDLSYAGSCLKDAAWLLMRAADALQEASEDPACTAVEPEGM